MSARIPPYSVFRLQGGPRPVRRAPRLRARAVPPAGWRDKSYAGSRASRFGGAPRVHRRPAARACGARRLARSPGGAPCRRGGGQRGRWRTSGSRSPRTARAIPLLVKVSYHPRWRAEGAHGPYLVSPALMLVVPRQETVRLVYARTGADRAGLGPEPGCPGGGLALALAQAAPWKALSPPVLVRGLPGRLRRRCVAATASRRPRAGAERFPLSCSPAGSWRALPSPGPVGRAQDLYERASGPTPTSASPTPPSTPATRARAAGPAPRRAPLPARREPLARGPAGFASVAFETLLRESPTAPTRPRPSSAGPGAGGGGGSEGAAADRRRLADGYPDTPWAKLVPRAAR